MAHRAGKPPLGPGPGPGPGPGVPSSPSAGAGAGAGAGAASGEASAAGTGIGVESGMGAMTPMPAAVTSPSAGVGGSGTTSGGTTPGSGAGAGPSRRTTTSASSNSDSALSPRSAAALYNGVPQPPPEQAASQHAAWSASPSTFMRHSPPPSPQLRAPRPLSSPREGKLAHSRQPNHPQGLSGQQSAKVLESPPLTSMTAMSVPSSMHSTGSRGSVTIAVDEPSTVPTIISSSGGQTATPFLSPALAAPSAASRTGTSPILGDKSASAYSMDDFTLDVVDDDMDVGAEVEQASMLQHEYLSVAEQEILASIQELQRQLSELKTEEQHDQQGEEGEKGEGAPSEALRDMRVIVVANRLPISASRDAKTGEWNFKMSSGGLVTALQGVRDEMEFLWIGWLGGDVPLDEQEAVAGQLLKDYSCVPVFLDDELVDKYYNGFSNDVLWPLFHYVPLPMYKAGGEKKFDAGLWEAYKEANIRFANVVSSVYMDGDFVWVHDYHLMRLPFELRRQHPQCRIGWFLHTPFPSSEIYRILPVRKPLLEGLLSADLVGFHTYDYARHFLSSCSRVLEVDCSPRGIEYNNHMMSLGVYPIGIDPDHVSRTLGSAWVQNRIRELEETFRGRKILLGVDRLDYIKGMPHKLLGLELFLKRYPEWHGRVTLIQVGVPSRTTVPEYRALANQVNELVGRINGNYGTLEYSPVHYINQSISQEELFAIYNVADVCLVTSVRDGMNLVSHEYVAAQNEACRTHGEQQKDGPGVLILSEFAGSAQSLSGAIRVNPWNTDQVAGAIHKALTLSRVERELRQYKLYRYIMVHTASFWAKSFLQEFREVCEGRTAGTQKLPTLPTREVTAAYRAAKNRLIICDYDGTLVQLQSLPQLAGPPPIVLNIMNGMCEDPRNRVFIVSGRERRFMDTWLGKLRAGLAAEYGFYYRMPDEKQWQSIGQGLDLSWKDVVQPIMQYFTERTPGTYVENKESSLTWHYRDADPHFGLWQAKDMQIHMEDVLSNMPLEILQGSRMVEVRHQAANKGAVAELVLRALANPAVQAERGEVDFIFLVGDDKSDEDMFQTAKRYAEQYAKASPVSPWASSSGGNIPIPKVDHLDLMDDDGSHAGELPPVPPVQTGWADSASTSGGRMLESCGRLFSRNAKVYSVHIGKEFSHADYKLDNLVMLRQVLRKFQSISSEQVLADRRSAAERKVKSPPSVSRG